MNSRSRRRRDAPDRYKDAQVEMSPFNSWVDPYGLLEQRLSEFGMVHLHVGVRQAGQRLRIDFGLFGKLGLKLLSGLSVLLVAPHR